MDYWITERPQKIEDIAGNDKVKQILYGYFLTNSLPHCILITGSSGTGKTSVANVIKNYLNVIDLNLHYLDMGAQSTIATVREVVKDFTKPAFGGDSKQNVVFIGDECHKLGKAAEGYLNSLENMKDNVYFICTTDNPNSLLKSFRSRFVELNMTRLTQEQVVEEVLRPCVHRNSIKIRLSTLNTIAEYADGNNRRALTILSAISAVDPEKHSEFLEQYKKDEESAPLNKAFEALMFYTSAKDVYNMYCTIMRTIQSNCDNPETARIQLLLYCGRVLSNPKNSSVLYRASELTLLMKSEVFTVSTGWAEFSAIICKFLRNFA